MTGADVAGLVVLGVVVVGGVGYVLMQQKKGQGADFGPYVQQPQPAYTPPPLPAYGSPGWSAMGGTGGLQLPPAQPNTAPAGQSSEALAWVTGIGGLVNSLGQTALGYATAFGGGA